MRSITWNLLRNSTIEDLKAAKLGLAGLMFVYVCVACYLPIFIFYLFDKYGRKSSRWTHLNNEETSTKNSSQRFYYAQTNCRCMNWSKASKQTVVSRANCLAAGAFLSVGLLDVFMDTMESVEDCLKALNINTHVPIAALLTLLGFFLVLGVEQIALAIYERQNQKHQQPETNQQQTEPKHLPGIPVENMRSCPSTTHICSPRLTRKSEPLTVFPISEECLMSSSYQSLRLGTDNLVHDHHQHLSVLNTNIESFQAVVLLFALSLHSVFEGLALGLCNSVSLLLTRFGALSVHKLLIAISIGLNLATGLSDLYSHSITQQQTFCQQFRSKTQILRFLAILLFAGASPLGTLIGWTISAQNDSAGFLVSGAILKGLACGTFLYVVFCELLPKEFKEKETDKCGKLVFLFIGFAVITVVICLLPDE